MDQRIIQIPQAELVLIQTFSVFCFSYFKDGVAVVLRHAGLGFSVHMASSGRLKMS